MDLWWPALAELRARLLDGAGEEEAVVLSPSGSVMDSRSLLAAMMADDAAGRTRRKELVLVLVIVSWSA